MACSFRHIECLATTRNRGFLRLSLRHGWAKRGERSANVSGDFGRFRPRTTCNKSLRRVEAITNTVVPHLVLLDNMLSAAACYGSQCYFIFQSLFYQLKSPRNTSLCTVHAPLGSMSQASSQVPVIAKHQKAGYTMPCAPHRHRCIHVLQCAKCRATEYSICMMFMLNIATGHAVIAMTKASVL